MRLTAIPISQCAIVVGERDNVAVVKADIAAGTHVALEGDRILEVSEAVTTGNRFALHDIPSGEYVRQYGQPIGTSLGIKTGAMVSHANMSDAVPVIRDVPADLTTPAPERVAEKDQATFQGFLRADGRAGTRNFILIVPTSMCASHEAMQISMLAEFTYYTRQKFPNVDGISAVPHNKGCGCQDGSPVETLLRVLSNYADHPNVGGVVLMELGCEKTNLSVVEAYLDRLGKKLNKPLERIGIQQVGGTEAAIRAGLAAVEKMLPIVNQSRREKISVEKLVLGVKCGGSDAFSGISANPSLGYASDLLIRNGGTVLITEVPEFCGGEQVHAHRAKDAATARKVAEVLDWYKN